MLALLIPGLKMKGGPAPAPAAVRPAIRYSWRGALARVLSWRGGVDRRRL
jgi:hypothetical protein